MREARLLHLVRARTRAKARVRVWARARVRGRGRGRVRGGSAAPRRSYPLRPSLPWPD